jgi:hypothetical protein
MVYRVFFDREHFIDLKKLILDDENRPLKGIGRNDQYYWIGQYLFIVMIPEKDEVINHAGAWKAGF